MAARSRYRLLNRVIALCNVTVTMYESLAWLSHFWRSLAAWTPVAIPIAASVLIVVQVLRRRSELFPALVLSAYWMILAVKDFIEFELDDSSLATAAYWEPVGFLLVLFSAGYIVCSAVEIRLRRTRPESSGDSSKEAARRQGEN